MSAEGTTSTGCSAQGALRLERLRPNELQTMSAKHAPQSADPTFAFHQIEPGTLVSTSPPAASAAAGTVHAPPILLRLPMVMRITGLARSTIYKLIAQNQFPAPIKLSKRAVAWLQSEIESWVSSRVRAL